VGLVMVGAPMLCLSWQVTVLALVLLPVFLLPAKFVGRRLQSLTRESMQLNAELNTSMTERFNVSGALLVKMYGRPVEESERFDAIADSVRRVTIKIAM